MIEKMNGSGKVCSLSKSCTFLNIFLTPWEALAEQYAISRSPLSRGLKVINTEQATVPMRCVSRVLSSIARILTRSSCSEKLYSEGGILSVTSRILVVDLLSSMSK